MVFNQRQFSTVYNQKQLNVYKNNNRRLKRITRRIIEVLIFIEGSSSYFFMFLITDSIHSMNEPHDTDILERKGRIQRGRVSK